MAKKVNEVQDGDLKSNIVVLRSVFGKVGQKYYIQPQKGCSWQIRRLCKESKLPRRYYSHPRRN